MDVYTKTQANVNELVFANYVANKLGKKCYKYARNTDDQFCYKYNIYEALNALVDIERKDMSDIALSELVGERSDILVGNCDLPFLNICLDKCITEESAELFRKLISLKESH